MLVTPHFAVEEFAQRARHGFPSAPYPEEWVESRLRPLAEVLEVIRTALGGAPIRVISGYRTPAYNARIGGAPRSRHMEGDAADIKVAGWAAHKVHDAVLELHEGQKINIGGLGRYATFTHVDVRPGPLARWGGGRPTLGPDDADEGEEDDDMAQDAWGIAGAATGGAAGFALARALAGRSG